MKTFRFIIIRLFLMNAFSDVAYIEITTRGGKGPFTQATPGTHLYKPIPLSIPMQFYRPKYAAKQPKETNDFRSTIHSEPNIVTDSNGKKLLLFLRLDTRGLTA